MWKAVITGDCSGYYYCRLLLAIGLQFQKGSTRVENKGRNKKEVGWLRIPERRDITGLQRPRASLN